MIGAGPHERTPGAVGPTQWPSGSAAVDHGWGSGAAHPQAAGWAFFPSLLERRRRVDQALFAVVMEAYLHGVSTRKVATWFEPWSDSGISKSEVSRICADLDTEVGAWDRSLAGQRFPYVFVDATYCKARVNRRVVAQAVVATGVRGDGRREVPFRCRRPEDGAFWTAFLRSLKARGLGGVQLVIADAHLGLRQAVQAVMRGAAIQRCRVHFLRNVLASVPKGSAEMVAAAIRTIFAQPDATHVHEQLDVIAGMLGRQFPKQRSCCATRPRTCWPSPTSRPTIGRRSGRPTRWSGSTKKSSAAPPSSASFPTPRRCVIAGAVLVEAHDEWRVSDRRYLSEGSMALLTQATKEADRIAELQPCARLPDLRPELCVRCWWGWSSGAVAVRLVGRARLGIPLCDGHAEEVADPDGEAPPALPNRYSRICRLPGPPPARNTDVPEVDQPTKTVLLHRGP